MATVNVNMYIPQRVQPTPPQAGHLWTQNGRIQDAVPLTQDVPAGEQANTHCQDPYYLASNIILQDGRLVIFILAGYEIDVNAVYQPTISHSDWTLSTWNMSEYLEGRTETVEYYGNVYTKYIYHLTKNNQAHTPISGAVTLSFAVSQATGMTPDASVTETENN